MGREQPSAGDGAEFLAGDYLRASFVDWGKWQAGAAMDLFCKGLRIARNSPSLYSHPTIGFHVQVKNSPARFTVGENTIRNWIRLCPTQPVFLLALERISNKMQRWRFLTFHEWLLSARGQAKVAKGNPVSFDPNNEFCIADDADRNLHDAFLSEAERAIGAAGSPWTTLQDYGLLPVDEALFLENLSFASNAEVPVKVYEALKELEPTVPAAMRGFIEKSLEPVGHVAKWINQIEERTLGHAATASHRQEFNHFVRVMKAWYDCGTLPTFPAFNVSTVGTWRSLSAMYSRSVGMYEAVVRHSDFPSDIQFASAMLSLLANAKDRETTTKAWHGLRALKGRLAESAEYGYQRELLRAPAEAGDQRASKDVVDFVTRPATRESEFQFLNGYGWKKEQLKTNLIRKLESPTFRDTNLRTLYEGMADALLL